jgi:type IV pilus assembly protein PilZ
MESIYLEYENDMDLYESYMPFFTRGGLFFRTDELYEMGTELTLYVILPDSLESACVKAQVSWVTPYGTQNGNDMGIGVSFNEDIDNVNQQIERTIARLLGSHTPTLSM